MKLKKIRLLPVVASILALLFSCYANSAAAATGGGGTVELIRQKWIDTQPGSGTGRYIESPSSSNPYKAGSLNPEFLNDGLKMANYVRFLAGLPDDLALTPELNSQAQYGAVLEATHTAQTGFLSHTPPKPAGMEESFYTKGYASTSSSNLFYSSDHNSTLADSIKAYMSDSDESNIEMVGHRRWILNPALKNTGFGFCDGAAVMQVFDRSRPDFNYEYIAWPARGNFPVEFFNRNDAWSLSLNPDKYDNSNTNNVKVSLKRKSDGREWNFSTADTNKQGKFFNVDTRNYGVPFCIIFKPDGGVTYTAGDEYEVRVTGLYNRQGQSVEAVYTTSFCSLDSKSRYISGTISLPDGDKAPEGGYDIYITNGYSSYGTTAFIPEGKSSASYTFAVDSDFEGGYNRVYYFFSTKTDKYITQAYYSSKGTVTGYYQAEFVTVKDANASGINLKVLKAAFISGRVYLPGGDKAPKGGISVDLTAASQEYAGGVTVYIPEGSSYGEYKIRVNAGSEGSRYEIIYFLNKEVSYKDSWSVQKETTSNHDYGYVPRAYYNPGGTQYTSSPKNEFIVTDSGITGVDIYLLKGAMISGIISLPDGMISEYDCRVYIYANNRDTGYTDLTLVVIPGGSSSVPFNLAVKPDREYRVEYEMGSADERFSSRGYFSKTGMTGKVENAFYLNVGTAESKKIELSLINVRKLIFSGVLRLPDGMTAPETGVNASVVAVPSGVEGKYFFKDVFIKPGEAAASFEIYATEELASDKYKLRYSAKSVIPGLITIYDYAAVHDVSKDPVRNIELVMKNGSAVISGRIYVPEGEKEAKDIIQVSVYFKYDDGLVTAYDTAIGTGKEYAEFSFRGIDPENAKSGILYCDYYSNNPGYVSMTLYYDGKGQTFSSNYAAKLDMSKGNLSGIDFRVIKSYYIPVKLKMPEDVNISADSLEFSLDVYSDEGYWKTLGTNIYEPGKELIVQVPVYAANSNIHLQYYMTKPVTGLASQGYYNVNGTVAEKDRASSIDLSKGNSPVVTMSFLKAVQTPGGTPAGSSGAPGISGVSGWASAAVESFWSNGLSEKQLFSNYKQNIKREEFAMLAVKLYEKATGRIVEIDGNPFNDIGTSPYKDYIIKAYKLNIIGGVGGGRFNPRSDITRQEISNMMFKLIKAVYPEGNYVVKDDIVFKDNSKIASWARTAVLYLYKSKIMTGDGSPDTIGPLNKATRETAFTLLYRMAVMKGII